MYRFRGGIALFLLEAEVSLLLIVYQVLTLPKPLDLYDVNLLCPIDYTTSICCSLGFQYRNGDLVTDGSQGWYPCKLLSIECYAAVKYSFHLTEFVCGSDFRQLEVATQWPGQALRWYFLVVRTRKERSDMIFTCSISSHRHGFLWTISKSSFWIPKNPVEWNFLFKFASWLHFRM